MKPTSTDFSWVKLNPSQYLVRAKQVLQNRKQVLRQVKAIKKANRTFANTVEALDFSGEDLSRTGSWLALLMNVLPHGKARVQAKDALDFLEAQAIELEFDPGVHKALKELAELKPKLVGERKKLFTEMLRDYRRMGLELPTVKQKQVKVYAKQLAKLASDFRTNINNYQDHILVSREELEGLSENYINGLQQVKGKYKVSLEYPDYVPFMENAHNEARRAELSHKYLKKGGKKNIGVLKKMVLVRDKCARLLGYKNHAHYILEVRMAKTPEAVKKFLQSLVKPLRPKVAKEFLHLEKLKQKLSHNSRAKLASHDIAYTINQDKKLRYGVDEELVRQYFPLEVVTNGMFKIYEQLLGVKFKQISGIPTWHKDVTTYSVSEKATGKLIAYFFLDLFPREGKYGHAAVFPIISGLQLPGGDYQKPLVSMVANFNKPSKTQPSLLSHHEVETYFHEFGHVVHSLLTEARYGSQSGFSVPRDFVEAPSQMLENWVWDKKMLSLLSGHYKNKKQKLPDSLLKKMMAAKQHMVTYTSIRQLTFGTFDIILHTETVKDIAGLYAKLVKQFTGLSLPKDQIFPAGFGHMDGYDAGYYGYMWSKVFASDMFTRFQKHGLLNTKVGHDYRKFILAPGGSEEAINLVSKFLGRKPNNKAFLKEIGVK